MPSPIRTNWVLEGNPVARNQLLSVSADGNARSYIWDCTAGRFNWFYEADETVYVIEGGVVLTEGTGTARRLCAGDTIFFPAGAHAEWHVENYIRKFALIRWVSLHEIGTRRRAVPCFQMLTSAGNY
jgi:uncharacterized cupin superfamily protein